MARSVGVFDLVGLPETCAAWPASQLRCRSGQLGGDVLVDPAGIVRLHHVGKGPPIAPQWSPSCAGSGDVAPRPGIPRHTQHGHRQATNATLGYVCHGRRQYLTVRAVLRLDCAAPLSRMPEGAPWSEQKNLFVRGQNDDGMHHILTAQSRVFPPRAGPPFNSSREKTSSRQAWRRAVSARHPTRTFSDQVARRR